MSFPWAKHYQPNSAIERWIDERLPLPRLVYDALGSYPAPKNLNYFWNFGSLAGLCLVLQLVTGIILAMHYSAHINEAFNSVERIMRDVNYGWLIRYMHMNGASFFFIVVYIHIMRGLYYGSYKAPREMLWILGVVILLLMMATAFMGYVLPWGQMSFWGAQVITGLFSAIPLIGTDIQTLLLGAPFVGNPALNKFFSLHYLLPFVITGVVILHIWALHIPGSNNPLGIDVKGPQDTVPFHPYYTTKDLFGVMVFLLVYCAFVFYMPNALGHPDNYIPADPLSTPAHIVPEWYFWPFYAILRAFTYDFFGIEAKLWGVMGMFAAILLLLFLPWLDNSPVRSAKFRPLYQQFFWVFCFTILVLGFCGKSPAEEPYVRISQVATAYYFLHFLVIIPIIARIEKPKPLPRSISMPVLAGTPNAPTPSASMAAPQVLPAE
jgi:ubiquinol-cytochrome c reductase cytochrome b subunit